jgi:hypothetical protein
VPSGENEPASGNELRPRRESLRDTDVASRECPISRRLEDSGTILNYEGHDQPKGADCANPKVVDQPDHYPSGSLTQNGKFHEAAQRFKSGQRDPERVRVYEKIRAGIWSNDHDLPWSKGGTSITEENVQLLCARHNLEKSDRIV